MQFNELLEWGSAVASIEASQSVNMGLAHSSDHSRAARPASSSHGEGHV